MKREPESFLENDELKKFKGSDCSDPNGDNLNVYCRTKSSKGKNLENNSYVGSKEGYVKLDVSSPVEGSKGKCVEKVVSVAIALEKNVVVGKGDVKQESEYVSVDGEELRLLDEGSLVDVPVEDGTLSMFGRALRVEVEVAGEPVGGVEAVEFKEGSNLDGGIDDEGGLGDSGRNSEVKVAGKVVLDQKPTTVKDLFETGLLEGVSVIYMGGKKATGLRGTIKDDGILCWCSMCRGHNVIPISQFEVHACKAYKRASEYICFENGKSLLDVLKACRDSPLHMLEATIHNSISSRTQKYSTCRRCKGSFAASFVANVEKLCRLCIQEKDCEPNSISASTQVVRSSGLDEISHSSRQVSGAALGYKRHQKTTIKSRQRCLKRESLVAASPTTPSTKKDTSRITSKDQRLNKLVFEEGGLLDGTELAYIDHGQKLIEGYKKDRGIFCLHCNCKVSPSQFESHAGWASRRKPYSYIYTSNGVSLHEFALSLSQKHKSAAKGNSDLCMVCADGGDLVLCNGCPRAFHKKCASLPSVPTGAWYCKYCQITVEAKRYVEHDANALAAGRIAGSVAIKQITKQSIRIVKDVEPELSACALCRGRDFNRSVFGPRTSIICDQCEKEFHAACLREHKIAKLKEIPKVEWFCGTDCKRINSTFNKLLVREAEKIPDTLLASLHKKLEGKGAVTNFDVRWKVLKGYMDTPESKNLLSQVVNIFHECFGPIVDPLTRSDLIPSMVYGKSARGQEFCGMYCAVLLVNSVVVSAAILRVFGREVAELPLVATRKVDHRQGYFKLLFSCIEKLLAFLNVTCTALPAAEEEESIWIEKFGFEKLNPQQASILKSKFWRMVSFKGTCMLQRMIPGSQQHQ